jgi:hypothetical protein
MQGHHKSQWGLGLGIVVGSLLVSPSNVDAREQASPGATTTISGQVQEYGSGRFLPGATVTVGGLPEPSTCSLGQGPRVHPCSAPIGPVVTTTTGMNGGFELRVGAPAQYMLTITNGAGYATLHERIAIGPSSFEMGSVKLTALTRDEQRWLEHVNAERESTSTPRSFNNLTVDEYIEEAARQWARDVASGIASYGDDALREYIHYYERSPGAMYQGGSGVGDLVNAPGAWAKADQHWFAEKAHCPAGDWSTCPFLANTGHYINLSQTMSVWIGLGESPSPQRAGMQWPGYYAYDVMSVAVIGPTPPPLAVSRASQ